MNKEFIPYELALELKELGFDEKCFAAMDMYSNIDYESEMYDFIRNSETVQSTWAALPLYQQAFRFFREKGFLIDITSHDKDVYEFYIRWHPNKPILSDLYNTYEEAELACLIKLINIVFQIKGGEVFAKSSDVVIEIAKNK